ncbi:hypothetical protein P43SY_001012 [Pythium insidiosum]|uniref:GB1/RHD3-type G domain-containing protein n=1 Tax=Pythium insidiosum TaxID=114742 RepID=A0AAD5Q969_PYTIN|nr:hypothetical protein P43SY_001012 [Pythium insidiosum]
MAVSDVHEAPANAVARHSSAAGAGPALDAPLPFIMLSEDNTFEVTPEAVRFLQSIKGPVAVVSIAGLYRTGKSYLLNLLLGRQRAEAMFNVGATVNACTKGIWIWGQPVDLTAASDAFPQLKKDTTIIFMDTEGLGSTDRSQTQDTRIFALALLLSSLFIYNSRGVIDSNAIEDLSLVVHLTKYIQAKAQPGATAADAANGDGSELAAFFPDFLWVVRDFTLKLQEDGRAVTPREYFERALKPQPALNDEVVQKNRIRSMLATFFPRRDCVTMVRPLNDESLLRELIHQPYESLRAEFREQMEVLKSKIFTALKPKQLMASALNGAMLVTLANSYVDAFNSGSTPVISSVWDRVLENQCEQALESAKQCFRQALDDKIKERAAVETVEGVARARPLEDAELNEVYEEARAVAEAELAQDEIRETEALASYAEQLSDFMLAALSEAFEKNDAASKAFNESLLLELTAHKDDDEFLDLNAMLDASDSDGSRVLHDKLTQSRVRMETAVTAYNARARGPAKSAVLAEFLADKLAEGLLEWGALVKTVFRSKEAQAETQIATAKQTLRALEGKVKAGQEVLTQQKESYERALQTISERITDERATLRQEIDSKQAEIDRAHVQIERLAALHKESIDRLHTQLEEAKQERKRLEDAQREAEERRVNARLMSHRQLLETQQNFHKEEKDILNGQQQLLQKVLDLERQLGEQDTEHMKELFRLEKEGQTQLSDLRLQYQDEQDALKERTIQDIRKQKEQQDEELLALQDQLSDKKALLASLRERVEAKEALAAMKKNKPRGGKDDCIVM